MGKEKKSLLAKKAATTTVTGASIDSKTSSAPSLSVSSEPRTPVAAAPAPEPTRPTPMVVRPSAEQIARRAYEMYRARNGRPGSALEDWTRAEQELSSTTQTRGTSA